MIMDFILGIIEKSGILGTLGALVAIIGIISITVAEGGVIIGVPLLLVGGGIWVWRRFFYYK